MAMLVDQRLHKRMHCQSDAPKVSTMLSCIKRGMASWDRDILPLYKCIGIALSWICNSVLGTGSLKGSPGVGEGT